MILVKHSDLGIASHSKVVGMLVLGVDLFFVLSGFLITQIILANKNEDHFYRNFYFRRFLRIMPIYYLFLLGNYVLGLYGGIVPRIPWNEMWRLLTFTQCLPFVDRIPLSAGAFYPTWSLAVEEQFYLVWPPLVCLLRRRTVAVVTLGVVAVAVVSRVFEAQSLNIAARCDGLALGALLAILLEAGQRRPALARRLVPGLALGGLVCLAAPFLVRVVVRRLGPSLADAHRGRLLFSLYIFDFDVFMACLIGLCVCCSGAICFTLLRNRSLRYVGRISYGIYLYHALVFQGVQNVFGLKATATPWGMLISFAAAIGVASLSWNLIENPILRLKARFAYHEQAVVRPDSGYGPDSRVFML